jgi:hypothetical protein
MRRIDAFSTARPDEGLTITDACAKFGCTAEQFARAVDKANRVFGTGIATEPCFRLGPRAAARKAKKSGKLPPIRASGASSSIFHGPTKPVKLNSGSTGPRVVHRDGDVVLVVSITEQETEEWQERERQRRARQTVPKPSAKAKTRSKKLMELVGDGGQDE